MDKNDAICVYVTIVLKKAPKVESFSIRSVLGSSIGRKPNNKKVREAMLLYGYIEVVSSKKVKLTKEGIKAKDYLLKHLE